MFSTVKQVHIAVEQGLQHIAANRKQSIAPEYIDMALNFAILQYIENSLVPSKNPIGRGFEHSQVPYDEFSPIRERISLPVYYSQSKNEYSSILPGNYKHLVNGEAGIIYDRVSISHNKILNANFLYVIQLEELDYTGVLPYSEISLTINHITIKGTNIANSIRTREGRFAIINHFLNEVRRQVPFANIYWEYYGDTYYKDKFIIVLKDYISTDNVYLKYTYKVNGTISITTIESTLSIINEETILGNATIYSPIELIKSSTKTWSKNNYFYNINCHRSVPVSIRKNRIIISNTNNFLPVKLNIEYLRYPSLISYKTDSLSELTINDKIIMLAIQYLKAIIKDEGYQYILNENKTI